MRTYSNIAKVGCCPAAARSRSLGVEVSLHTSMIDIPAVPIQYQEFRWHYVKGYLCKKDGRSASPYYLWRAKRLHGQASLDAYYAGRRAYKVLQRREDEAA